MIRLATVFSGIGAIEHALKRMGIENKIVFACDNGEVEILTKKIDQNIDKIKEEIEVLDFTIKKMQNQDKIEDLYQQQLLNMLDEMSIEYKKITYQLDNIIEPISNIESVLNFIVNRKI